RHRGGVRLRLPSAWTPSHDTGRFAASGGRMKSARLLIVAACVVATGGYLRLVAASDVALSAPHLDALPLAIGEWRGRDEGQLDAQTESILRADAYTLRTYGRGGAPLSLVFAEYGAA